MGACLVSRDLRACPDQRGCRGLQVTRVSRAFPVDREIAALLVCEDPMAPEARQAPKECRDCPARQAFAESRVPKAILGLVALTALPVLTGLLVYKASRVRGVHQVRLGTTGLSVLRESVGLPVTRVLGARRVSMATRVIKAREAHPALEDPQAEWGLPDLEATTRSMVALVPKAPLAPKVRRASRVSRESPPTAHAAPPARRVPPAPSDQGEIKVLAATRARVNPSSLSCCRWTSPR
jgi:hypothetical protein